MIYRCIKRILDILLSLILLIILLPFLFIIAIIIRIDSKGPAIFKQSRLGLNAKVFNIYKFRSMKVGSEKNGSGVYSFKNDGRVTRVGRFIRATSIDELPQLLNILKGDMSFIGPRPTLTYHPWPLEEYSDFQLIRFSVRPGITGWAQVNGRKELSWDERIKKDVEYVDKLSFLFDLKIFFLTIKKVLFMQDNKNVSITTTNNEFLKLMYITNDPEIAVIAEEAGVDRIFIDLEIIGKEERQANHDTVISHHNFEDIKTIKSVLKKAQLLVRINPIHENTKDEVEKAINYGADIIMLPFFKTIEEVQTFINLVKKRTRVCLLCETPEAVELIDDIIEIDGIDEIHIGLNDLHLGYHKTFMFELLSDGTVEKLSKKFKEKKIFFGFGGIASLNKGLLKAEHIIIEHYRLGSSMVILSRSFCDLNKIEDKDKIKEIFKNGIKEIREFEQEVAHKDDKFYEQNKQKTDLLINEIVNKIKSKE